MSNKRLFYFIVPIIIVSGIGITINRFLDKFYLENNEKCIYNDNSKIVLINDNYSYLDKKGINENSNTDIYFKFTGMDTIWQVISNHDAEIHIKYNSNIESGKFKVVLIDSDNNITNILEQSQLGDSTYSVKKGINRIKIVGSRTTGNLKMDISIRKDENGVDVVAINS
ncbi:MULTISPECIES: hypothetical protein [Clostridium]|uniref:hypothetical protein n=1 Tax=Clostridium TaxID=1485 RepID=UPI001897837D|nr:MULTISPECIES: hypothetical protein [Clostridium]MDI9216471.1 hypothetical protein [Clostridium tertium]